MRNLNEPLDGPSITNGMAMKTAIVDTRADIAKSVATAVAVLKSKNLVAIPTETVYGLAGDALEPEALAKIFEAKERPYFDPLIIHVGSKEWLDQLTRSSHESCNGFGQGL
jgi:tRNA A37 threonylcarbamoyladenosine synthetase subunit TsaC/SUA5/YrdC